MYTHRIIKLKQGRTVYEHSNCIQKVYCNTWTLILDPWLPHMLTRVWGNFYIFWYSQLRLWKVTECKTQKSHIHTYHTAAKTKKEIKVLLSYLVQHWVISSDTIKKLSQYLWRFLLEDAALESPKVLKIILNILLHLGDWIQDWNSTCAIYHGTIKASKMNYVKWQHLHCTILISVKFEVFMGVTMKNGVFWDIMPCGSCKNRRFGGTQRLLHWCDKNRWTTNNASCS
jgi:hypothetical protein